MSNDDRRPTEGERSDKPGRPGTVASEKSLTEERDPSFDPQNLHGAAHKVSEESEAQGVLTTARKALEEVDRQVSGEYEDHEEGSSAHLVNGDSATAGGDRRATTEPQVAAAQVAAEEERFDGLVNEPANPPREPGLQRSDGEKTRRP